MDFSLEIDHNDHTVKIKAACKLSQPIRKKILLKIADQLKKYDYSKALIDLAESSFDYNTPMTGALELTAFMETIGIPGHAKIAIIYSEAEAHRKYYEKASQDAGYNVLYFKNLNDAMAWLKK